MAVQTKVNPIQANVARHFNGKSVTAVTVTLAAGNLLTDSDLGPNGTFQAIIRTITQEATPILISAIRANNGDEGRVFDVYYEGEFGTDTWNGTNNETYAAYLQRIVRALGADVDGINLTNAGVAYQTPNVYQADQINAAANVPFDRT
jgi:hypothetical protein